MRYGVGASRKVRLVAGRAGMRVCCHDNGKRRDSMPSNNVERSLEKKCKIFYLVLLKVLLKELLLMFLLLLFIFFCRLRLFFKFSLKKVNIVLFIAMIQQFFSHFR